MSTIHDGICILSVLLKGALGRHNFCILVDMKLQENIRPSYLASVNSDNHVCLVCVLTTCEFLVILFNSVIFSYKGSGCLNFSAVLVVGPRALGPVEYM